VLREVRNCRARTSSSGSKPFAEVNSPAAMRCRITSAAFLARSARGFADARAACAARACGRTAALDRSSAGWSAGSAMRPR
jgi:hypothetical protein